MGRIRSLWLFLGLVLFAVSFYDVTADVIPSENECRPYIEKAIHELKNTDTTTTTENDSIEEENTGGDQSIETTTTSETIVEGSSSGNDDDDNNSTEEAVTDDVEQQEQQESQEQQEQDEDQEKESVERLENSKEDDAIQQSVEEGAENDAAEHQEQQEQEQEQDDDSKEVEKPADDDSNDSKEQENEENSEEKIENNDTDDSKEEATSNEEENATNEEATADEVEVEAQTEEQQDETELKEDDVKSEQDNEESAEGQDEAETQTTESSEDTENNAAEDKDDSKEIEETSDTAEAPQTEEDNDTKEEENDTKENEAVAEDNEDSTEGNEEESVRSKRSTTDEATAENEDNDTNEDTTAEESDNKADDNKSQENEAEEKESQENEGDASEIESQETDANENESQEAAADEDSKQTESDEEAKSEETMPEEELTLGFEIPKNLRSRSHISDLLGLDAESSIKENALKRTGDVILKDLKRIYDNAIKPLETMYKYRELSNRHYGDPEIFSKPLIVFMGPYSGGKSTILNYLTDNEYTPNSIRSGAEPSPAYFNILMHGDEPEVLDGTQLAADWTFSGLQKFGQGLNDRLRGQKLPNKLLERVNIVEIPGILEVRKQVSRHFPFNDACQWFIDRADIIFLVYDPAKLDVGPETEAILDQLKGREYQTRILLNKGDSVKPEELLRVQSALIWNISPLMSSVQPPVMYTVSLWSHPYEQGSPLRLLQAQERAMLADLREAIDKRIENKIASARRFAVRIRNHAKMVDCYLTTYYNQKTLFSNKKQVSDKIIEHPQNYNIYEGLSTLTNISRYDLPDPEVYLDFFRLNPLYEFKKLSETCTYFKGCPINKLDIAIAYELPELVGKYKKLLEENFTQLRKEFDENCNQSNIEPPVKLNSR